MPIRCLSSSTGRNRCELLTYEGETHSFFNKDKYLELALAEAENFLSGLGWLEKVEAGDGAKSRR